MTTKKIVYADSIGNFVTNSHIISETFGKKHADVMKQINTLLDNEKSEEDSQELITCFQKTYYAELNGIIHQVYEMTIDGFEILAPMYSAENPTIDAKSFISEFNRFQPSIFKSQEQITDKKQVSALYELLDSESEKGHDFRRALFHENNQRALIIKLQQQHIDRLEDELSNLKENCK